MTPQEIQTVANAFASSHPELSSASAEINDINSKVIIDVMEQSGWDYSFQNLDAAYAVCKMNGWLQGVDVNSQQILLSDTPRPDRDGSLVSVPASEQEFFEKASTSEMRRYLETKYAVPQQNMLDAFPQFGGRVQDYREVTK